MRLLSLASGSSGNSIYIGSDNTHILVDAGISYKRIEEGLNSAEISSSDIDAIFITHEHDDHIKALGILSRKLEIPVFTTAGTAEAIIQNRFLGDFRKDLIKTIAPDEDFLFNDITIHPFRTYHDAAEPVGYRFSNNSASVAIATDMGHYDDYIIQNLKGLSAILLEANHDVRMLESGSYPYYLKRRILSDYGHLSNEDCGKLLNEIINDNIKHIILGHLSKENNYPELAYEAVRMEINMSEKIYKADDFNIDVARRDTYGSVFDIT